jgi:formylglycine-generating enzyme required for sulfatase activity
MKPINVFAAAMAASFAAFTLNAAPSISEDSVVVTQDAVSRMVKVSYTLVGGPAIVTAEFLTNGVSIGRAGSQNVYGDVNRIVRNTSCQFKWSPLKAWPNQQVEAGGFSVRLTAWAMDAAPDYMVVDLTAPRTANRETVSFYQSESLLPLEVTNSLYKTDRLVMRKIPAQGVRWMMGGVSTEFSYASKWETQRYVTLTNDYFMAVYPVTQAQYAWFKGVAASCQFAGSDRPVDTISYNGLRGSKESGYDWPNTGHAVAAGSVLDVLATYTNLEGFDLPTDAEWEYACRAGCATAFYDGTTLRENEWNHLTLTNLAWTADNAGKMTHPVGLKLPNAFGLYDMLGNVAEWVLDWAVENYDTDERVAPTGSASGTARFLRGGGWPHDERTNRIASHQYQSPSGAYVGSNHGSCGFRPVLPASFK